MKGLWILSASWLLFWLLVGQIVNSSAKLISGLYRLGLVGDSIMGTLGPKGLVVFVCAWFLLPCSFDRICNFFIPCLLKITFQPNCFDKLHCSFFLVLPLPNYLLF